eukprot:3521081-Alexandrium_andersonii.AAC.1
MRVAEDIGIPLQVPSQGPADKPVFALADGLACQLCLPGACRPWIAPRVGAGVHTCEHGIEQESHNA